ncbi:hypothetical protein F0562_027733 [Nyssa sinensis]|uniref:Phytocyanin domain-containing protein n=1 Tax=Nyssa sinensis TaxID=561372 RepID=A0A5J5B4F9_9ASTE|nr:hypothetical protein F0562_027733 [Nyssa sinensis]
MASSVAGIVCLILLLCSAIPSLATVYTVGDSTGWAMSVDYSTWTSGKTFVVGDTLAFNYGSGHTVDEVSASDYSTCTVGNAITSDSSGSTTIPLKAAGKRYFICGVMGHCGSGMKLAVTVSAAPTTTPSGTPPSSAGTTTSRPTPTTVTTPSSSVPASSSSVTLSPFVVVLISFCVALFNFVKGT